MGRRKANGDLRVKRAKITIVGAGNVGATAAHWALTKELGDIVLVDVIEGIPQGKSLDLLQSTPVAGLDIQLTGSNDYAPTKDSDLVIVTAGLARKPGMSRDELLAKNTAIVSGVVRDVVKYSPNTILIIVSNPLDAMAYVALKASSFPKQRVLGMAGVLDSARFRTFLAQELNVSVQDVVAFVLGGHGDTMVPLPRLSSVGGIPIPSLLSQDRIDAIVERTRDGGAQIVNLLKAGSAYYAPAAAVIEMAQSILRDQKRVLPCAAYLEGEYGIRGCFMGVPVKLGKVGIEKIYEVQLNPAEKDALLKSAQAVKDLTAAVKI